MTVSATPETPINPHLEIITLPVAAPVPTTNNHDAIQRYLYSDEELGQLPILGTPLSPIADITIGDIDGPGTSPLSIEQRLRVVALLQQHEDDFNAHEPGDRCNFPPMEFTMKPGARPVRMPLIRKALPDLEEERANIVEYTKRGWIQPAEGTDGYRASCFVVNQVTKRRWVVNYTGLNSVTEDDVYPAPSVEEALEHLKGAEFFAILDLQSAYHQCDLLATDRSKTTFSADGRLYQFNVVPFGLKGAPAYFQRHIAATFEDLQRVFTYLDDICIAAETFDQLMTTLKTVLERIHDKNLRLKASKCKIAVSEMSYLGIRAYRGGHAPDREKIEAMIGMASPTDIKGLRSFLGMAGYYHRYLDDFAETAAELYILTRTKTRQPWVWTIDHEAAMRRLINEISELPLMEYLDNDKELAIFCDASGIAIGAVLCQSTKGADDWRPMAFHSRLLTVHEQKYAVQEIECLALVSAVRKWHIYVSGRPTTVFTDHRALKWLQGQTSPSGRITRWSLEIAVLILTIVHIPGRDNHVADCLSRLIAGASLTDDPELLDIHDRDTWAQEQSTDDYCLTIIQSIDDNQDERTMIDNETSGFVLIDGILCNFNEGQQRIVVPQSLIQEVLKGLHDSPQGGHMGLERTCATIQMQFFWVGWRQDVKNHIQSCEACQARRASTAAEYATSALTSTRNNDLVALDICGPIHMTSSGKKYILVIIDIHSHFVVTTSMEDQLAVTVATAFCAAWVAYFGPPLRLLSDNGPNFSSELFHEMLNLLEIRGVRTSPYNPRGNGMVERFNRTMAEMLSKFCDERQTDWDLFLPLVTQAYNASVHTTSGQIPFTTFCGWVPFPLVPIAQPTSFAEWTAQTAFGDDIKNALLTTSSIVKGIEEESSKNLTYEKGDKVLLRAFTIGKGLSRKLLKHKWRGPYEVIATTGALEKSLVLRSLIGGDKLKSVRASFRNVKRWIDRKLPAHRGYSRAMAAKLNEAEKRRASPTPPQSEDDSETQSDSPMSPTRPDDGKDSDATSLNRIEITSPMTSSTKAVVRSAAKQRRTDDQITTMNPVAPRKPKVAMSTVIARSGRTIRLPENLRDFSLSTISMTHNEGGFLLEEDRMHSEGHQAAQSEARSHPDGLSLGTDTNIRHSICSFP